MCKCIEKVNENLRKATGDPKARLDYLISLSDNSGKARLYVPYTYRSKKSNGEFTKEKEGKLALSHCPFCFENFDNSKTQIDKP